MARCTAGPRALQWQTSNWVSWSSSDDGLAIEISDFYIDTVVNTQYAVKVPRVNKIGVTNFTSNRIYL